MGKTTEQIVEVRNGVKETISNVNDRVDNRIAQLDNAIDEKLATLRENVRAEVDKAIAPIDSDGDGRADFGEAVAYLKKDDNWKDPMQWVKSVVAVVGTLLGLYGAKKGGAPLGRAIVAAVHKKGRSELEKRGEPSKNGDGDGNPPPTDSS